MVCVPSTQIVFDRVFDLPFLLRVASSRIEGFVKLNVLSNSFRDIDCRFGHFVDQYEQGQHRRRNQFEEWWHDR
jgi:hypothetical protein